MPPADAAVVVSRRVQQRRLAGDTSEPSYHSPRAVL